MRSRLQGIIVELCLQYALNVCELAALMLCISGLIAKRISAIATAIYQEQQFAVDEF